MKEKKNKRITGCSYRRIKLFLFLFMFTMMGSFINESVFADDKGETKQRDVHIRVIINNPNSPIQNNNTGNSGLKSDKREYTCKDSRAINFSNSGIHNQSLCLYLKENIDNNDNIYILEEGKNIDLDSNVYQDNFIIKKKNMADNISVDKQIVSVYEKNMLNLFIESYKNNLATIDEVGFDIKLSTISEKKIYLKNSIVDAYLIIRNQDGEIMRKEDLFDIEKGIDVLGLIEKDYFDKESILKINKNFYIYNRPGKYSAEIVLVLSPDFLGLNNKLYKNYLIEVKSNQIDFNIEDKDNLIAKNSGEVFWNNSNIWRAVAVAGLGVIGWWWILILFKRRLYKIILKFVTKNEGLIKSLVKGEKKALAGLRKHVKPRMLNLVKSDKIHKVLEEVLKDLEK